jgi:hypothetical protein
MPIWDVADLLQRQQQPPELAQFRNIEAIQLSFKFVDTKLPALYFFEDLTHSNDVNSHRKPPPGLVPDAASSLILVLSLAIKKSIPAIAASGPNS